MAETNSQPLGSTSLQPLSEPGGNKSLSKGTGSKARKSSSTLLTDIKFERKNKPRPRLPPNHRIQKRPITHPPIAALYAGPDVQKVVYVSKNTPIMAAVKRVKKLLEQAEKRNLQREGVLGTGKRAGNIAAAPQRKNRTKQEVVLVKASGRAIEQAARVGEWFKRHAEDGDGGWIVDVRPSSVKVIDDIVEDSSTNVDNMWSGYNHGDDSTRREESALDCSASDNVHGHEEDRCNQSTSGDNPLQGDKQASQAAETAPEQKAPRLKKRKRPMYDEEDVPEARTRFIHAIEIAVSLKG